MSTEIATAVEQLAGLSEPGFVPLLQLWNILDEGRKELFSQQLNAAPHGYSVRSQRPE